MKTVLLLLLTLGVVRGTYDNTVCDTGSTPPPGPQPMPPQLPPTFEVHIECIFVDQNMSLEVHEWFDYSINMGVIQQTTKGSTFYGYFDYNNNQFIRIYPFTKTCYVTDISEATQRFLFGFKPNGQGEHIYTAAGALHFSGTGVNEVNLGPDTVRGINVQKWHSCQYWQNMDATMNVTWYFSDPDTWDMALNIPDVPVRARVIGKVGTQAGGPAHSFNHIYDFIHFKNYIETPNAFETPGEVSCPGRVNTRPFPYVAPAFHQTVEIVDKVNQDVTSMKEWFDYATKLTKYVYTPIPGASMFGTRSLTEIHDFNTGMAYVTDNELGNCSWVPIEQSTFDDENAGPYDVRQRTSQEFFYMNADTTSYEGVKKTRNIEAYNWVGRRSDYPPKKPINSTWQWFFRTDNYSSAEDHNAMFHQGVPLQLTVSMGVFEYEYNIFDYTQNRPDLLNWDISACYINLNRRSFDFTVPGSYAATIDRDRTTFGYTVLEEIVVITGASPLRIAKLRLVFEEDVHIRFDFLDTAPMKGDVHNESKEVSLDVAVASFMSAVNNNQFVIPFTPLSIGMPINIVVTPNSIREYTYEDELYPKDTGYSDGAMGGLGFGMLVVGVLGGGGGGYFFFK
ncbi:uncharacterized protein LOC124289196 [Haliotis rubra]|uniref:uncharacterized protein LOC124289196 n=1 Tax=Haliotis rubra TaxID=36100 RepID=UPI001EE515C5|nr:uncharacterized protein LOC124289196 [Haliotis rubra]XP_046581758.1 uncharacterized protein LOC124289196 [Haliotis rubra]